MFFIPKIIRIYFLFDGSLLKELARIAWEVLGLYYRNSVNKYDAIPAAAASIQTFGDFLGFNPHLHIVACDGCLKDGGMFYTSPDTFFFKMVTMLHNS